MIARDIMSRDVITVSPSTTVKDLAKVLIQHQVSGAPVMNRKGKVVGVVSEADIVAKKGKRVKTLMSTQVVEVSEETPVEEIARLMTIHEVTRLPVMQRERLVGIVSRTDIVRAIAIGEHMALHTPIYDL